MTVSNEKDPVDKSYPQAKHYRERARQADMLDGGEAITTRGEDDEG